MFLWIKQDWSFSQWDLNYSKLINLLVLIDNRKNCVERAIAIGRKFFCKIVQLNYWTCLYFNFFGFFSEEKLTVDYYSWRDNLSKSPNTHSQTWTTSHDVTKMSTHITKTVFQARKKEWVLQLQQILNLVFKNNVKFYAYGSRAIKVKTRIFKVIMT